MAKKAIARKTSTRRDNVVRLDMSILLNNVRKSAFGYARGESGLVEAIRAAAGNNDPAKQNDLKRAFWEGHMAFAMFPDADTMTAAHLAEARRVLDQKTKDRESGHAAMYDNARQVWSRLLKRIGVASADNRGGDTSGSKGPRPGGNKKGTDAAPSDDEGMTANNSIVAAPVASLATMEQIIHVIKFEGKRMRDLANTHAGKLPGEYVRELTNFANWTDSIPATEEEKAEAPAKPAKPAPRKRR